MEEYPEKIQSKSREGENKLLTQKNITVNFLHVYISSPLTIYAISLEIPLA
jgi:hypothetical protein